MSRQYKAGMKLRSAVCDTQLITLRVPSHEIDLRIGGAAALLADEQSPSATLDPMLAGGTLVGKRYVDVDDLMEFLCTKAGEGTLSVDGRLLVIKAPKALPSSD